MVVGLTHSEVERLATPARRTIKDCLEELAPGDLMLANVRFRIGDEICHIATVIHGHAVILEGERRGRRMQWDLLMGGEAKIVDGFIEPVL